MDFFALLIPVVTSYPEVFIVATALGAVGEALSLIPSVKANGVFQLVYGLIKKVTGK